MQYGFSQILSLFVFTILLGCIGTINLTYAQESDFLYEDGLIDERHKDPTVILPDEPFVEKEKSFNKKTSPSTDKLPQTKIETKGPTTPVEQPVKETVENEVTGPGGIAPPEDPDSPLSFNFLYYIIQKFKFSDIVDE